MSALAANRCACARLIGSAVLIARLPRENQNDHSSPGRKVVPSAVPPCFRRCRTLLTGGPSRLRDDRSALPCIAGALRRSLLTSAALAASWFGPEAPGAIPSSSSLRLAPAAGSLDRHATGTRPVHSPSLRDVRGVWARAPRGVKHLDRTVGPRVGVRPLRAGASARCVSGTATRGSVADGGGEGGIRTHEVFRLSAFQERRHQPLGHLSGGQDTSGYPAVRPAPALNPSRSRRGPGTTEVPRAPRSSHQGAGTSPAARPPRERGPDRSR